MGKSNDITYGFWLSMHVNINAYFSKQKYNNYLFFVTLSNYVFSMQFSSNRASKYYTLGL